MGLATLHETIELTVINCGECGGSYAINERYRLQREQKGGSWNCPYCQVGWGYSGNSENSRLKKQLEAERNANNFLRRQNEQERNRVRAQKAAKTRIKNRIHNGVCPCCNRTFQNLAAHMKNQHPDYTKQED